MQLVEPSGLPLVDRLCQELQELRERIGHQEPICVNHKVSQDESIKRSHKWRLKGNPKIIIES